MTEEEWLSGCELGDYWKFFYAADRNARKHRLCICECVRLISEQLIDRRHRRAIEMSERFADGQCKLKHLHRARLDAEAASIRIQMTFGFQTPQHYAALAAESVAQNGDDSTWGFRYTSDNVMNSDSLKESQAALVYRQLTILRDIFGNPFRPVAFAPEWRTDTVMSLARGMYERRDFGAMPILADALQDAGCDSTDILNHCRGSEQSHVRGCWVVDLVFGKS